MASRILVAVVGIPMIIAVLFFCPTVCMAVAIAILCSIAAYEMLWETGCVQNKVMLVASCIMSSLVPFWFYFNGGKPSGFLGVLLFCIILFGTAFSSVGAIKLGQISACLFSGLLIPAFLSAMLLIADLDHHHFYILMPVIAAFSSDVFALFAGMMFGKHKLAPVLSPHKTIEGSIGGVVGSVIVLTLYGFALGQIDGVTANLPMFAVFGLLGSAVSQFGDLTFSYIKREFHLKDYGRIFLAHGGVLDRFDSLLFCAPLTAVLLQVIPFFTFQ